MAADIVTVDTLKQLLDISTTTDDNTLMMLAGVASKMVEQYCGRSFVPQWATRYFDARGTHVTRTLLETDDDLLQLISLTVGATAIPNADLLLLPYNDFPKHAIRIRQSASYTFYDYDTDWEAAIAVNGIWGYHAEWDSYPWIDSLDSVENDGGITSNDTSIKVSNLSGVDASGTSPRFMLLGYYLIDTEVVQVVGRTTTMSGQFLQVRRGALGTTATAHDKGAKLYRYRPQHDIEMATLSLASWLYRNKTNVGEKYQYLDGTQLVINEAPSHILMTLNMYRKLKIG